MEGKVLNIFLILGLATFANIDGKIFNFWEIPIIHTKLKILVTNAGSSPHDVCELYVNTFKVIYNETVTSLDQAFNDAVANLVAINMYIPPEDYQDQLNMIVSSWIDENNPTLQAAFNAAVQLTGTSIDYINSIIDGSVTNPPSPISCLYDMLIELNGKINSLFAALETKSQLLADSQLIVGEHRPSLVPSDSSSQLVSSSA